MLTNIKDTKAKILYAILLAPVQKEAGRLVQQHKVSDISIAPQWRAVIRYGLETNDPWLADLVRRADAGETIIDTIDFSQTAETNRDDSIFYAQGGIRL